MARAFAVALLLCCAHVQAQYPSRPIHLVCAGTDGFVSFEDTLLAGLIADDLDASGPPLGNRMWISNEPGPSAG